MSKWIYILWPSFAAAAIGEIFFFAFIDPKQLFLLGEPIDWSPIAVYSVGFFMFWGVTGLTTALTGFFRRPAAEINGPIESRPGAGPVVGTGGKNRPPHAVMSSNGMLRDR